MTPLRIGSCLVIWLGIAVFRMSKVDHACFRTYAALAFTPPIATDVPGADRACPSVSNARRSPPMTRRGP